MARTTKRESLSDGEQPIDRIRIPYKFSPRSHQRKAMAAMDEGCNRIILIWHRRAGKDKTALQMMIKKMPERVGAYYYFFPVATQARKVIWDGMDDTGFPFLGHFPPQLIAAKNETEMQIVLKNGSIFQVIGTDKIDTTGVGTNFVGGVYSEYSIQNPKAWDLCRPILNANGGWAIFPYTPRGKNHGHKLYKAAQSEKNWFTQLLTVDDTLKDATDGDGNPLVMTDANGNRYGETGGRVVTDEMIAEDKRLGMSEEMVQQEYYCSFEGGLEGSYYGDLIRKMEREGRVRSVPHDLALPVSTAWDLGAKSDTMAVGFIQQLGAEIRWIDYESGHGQGIPYFAHAVKEQRSYVYDTHFMPHDVEATEIGSGKTRIEIARKLGLNPIRVTGRFDVMDGIEAVRRIFPQFYMDEKKCEPLLNALKEYRKEWDEKKKMFKDTPYHDWASHPSDMVRTYAIGRRAPRSNQTYKPAQINFDPRSYAEAEVDFNPYGE